MSGRREWERAASAFEKALSKDKYYTEARLALAEVLYKMRQFDRAREHFSLCLQERPNDQTALHGLALSQIALGKYDSAQTTLEKLLTENPENWQAWLMHGDAAMQLGRKDIAIASWQNATRSNLNFIRRGTQERLDRYQP